MEEYRGIFGMAYALHMTQFHKSAFVKWAGESMLVDIIAGIQRTYTRDIFRDMLDALVAQLEQTYWAEEATNDSAHAAA